MSKYLKSELYRILKKKSFYILLLIVSVGFVALNYMILPSDATIEEYLQPVGMLVSFIPMILGIYIYITVFNDDFNNNIINASVGFGIKRYKLVIYKLIETLILSLIIILVLTGVFFLVGAMYKFTYSSEIINKLILLALKSLVMIVGYSSIASITVYATKKALYGTILYLLLCTGAMYSLLSLVLTSDPVMKLIGDRSGWLFTNLTEGFMNEDYVKLIGVGIYIIVSVVISIIMFKKLELEFD